MACVIMIFNVGEVTCVGYSRDLIKSFEVIIEIRVITYFFKITFEMKIINRIKANLKGGQVLT